MASDHSLVAAAYLEHLSDADLVVLAGRGAKEAQPGELRRSLLQRRGGIDDLLSSHEISEAVFGSSHDGYPLVGISPFLVFAVAVHQAVLYLQSATYVPEWTGIGRRTPVFDTASLRAFASSPWRRLFLAELLGSYTHVASGSVVVPTRRGLRRHRFSELDPVRLAGLLEVVSDDERPGVLRRLGDLSLFLTGVFPDYLARHGFGPIEEGRLLRAGQMGAASRHGGPTGGYGSTLPGDGTPVALLERLGRRWYQAAFDLLPHPVPSTLAVLGELNEHFGDARRILGLLTERFLFPYRDRWFGFESN